MKLKSLLLALLILTGCASAPPIPPELQYVPPSGPGTSLSTIMGSQEDSTFFDDFTAYIIGVDGKRVMSGRKAWSTPLPIQAGQRNITVMFQRGRSKAQADLVLQAVAGEQYQVRFSSDAQLFGANTYCDFWIVNMSTQTAVTEIKRGVIGGVWQTTVPVFIPTH